MSEAGHAILMRRANKVRHRSQRNIRRNHRENLFDESDAEGDDAEQPVEEASSGEEAEAELEAEEERRIEEQRARFQAATAAAAAALLPPPPPVPALSAALVRAQCESELAELTTQCRAAEGRLRKGEAHLRQMSQWKATTIMESKYGSYDFLSIPPSRPELTELVKLRFYRRLVGVSVARQWVREFRARRTLKQLHEMAQRCVEGYMQAHAGREWRPHQQQQQQPPIGEQEQHQQQTPTQTPRHRSRRAAFAEEEKGESASAPASSVLSPPSIPPSSLSTLHLSVPSSLPHLFASPTPILVGSLTDYECAHGSPHPLNILNSAAVAAVQPHASTAHHATTAQPAAVGAGLAHPGARSFIALQAELQVWLTQSRNMLAYGTRTGRIKRPHPVPPCAHAIIADTRRGSSGSADAAAAAVPPIPHPLERAPERIGVASIRELLAVLMDVGPVLRCMVESLLNGYGGAQQTLRAFEEHTQQLQTRSRAQASEMAQLDAERAQWEGYLHRALEQLSALFSEAKVLRQSMRQHASYESKLRRAVRAIRGTQQRRAVDKRKEQRMMAAWESAQRSAVVSSSLGASQSAPPGANPPPPPMPYLGVNATMLVHSQRLRTQVEEAEKQMLLREVIASQEAQLNAAAQRILHERMGQGAHTFTTGSTNGSTMQEHAQPASDWRSSTPPTDHIRTASSSSTASSSATPTPSAALPPDLAARVPRVLAQLEALLDASLPTPHLSAFLARRKGGVEGAGAVETAIGGGSDQRRTRRGSNRPESARPKTAGRPVSARSVGTVSSISPSAAASGVRSPNTTHGASPSRDASASPSRASPPRHTRSFTAVVGPFVPSDPPGCVADAAEQRSGPPRHAPSASMHDRLEYHNNGNMHVAAVVATAAGTGAGAGAHEYSAQHHPWLHPRSPSASSSASGFGAGTGSGGGSSQAVVPLVAYPPPPSIPPLRAPPLRFPDSFASSHSSAPFYSTAAAATSAACPGRGAPLLGGLPPSAVARELHKLKASPYMQSSLLTPQQEVDLMREGQIAAASAARATPPAAGSQSARGSRPLKAPLPPAATPPRSTPASARVYMRGASPAALSHHKLVQQKVRIEQHLNGRTLFDAP